MAIDRAKIDVKISNDIIPFINRLNVGKTLDDKVNLSIAIGLFVTKNVTLARGAEIACISLGEFVDVLKSQGIPWGEYAEEQERMDDASVQNLLSRMAGNND
jgi:predicted HTH domain antitoxin